MKLHKKGGKRPFEKNDYIYQVVENTTTRPQKPLEIILTKYVENVGEKGDKIKMRQHKAYQQFLLPGLAVYASPDNIKKYYIDRKDQTQTFSSLYVPSTMYKLSRCCLCVEMSIENPWVLEKWHIRTHFRRRHFVVAEDAITLPEKEISGPNLDIQNKEFYVTVTINKTESVKVRCKIHHVTLDYSKELPLPPEYYKVPGEAIFKEDQEVLDSLPRPAWEDEVEKK